MGFSPLVVYILQLAELLCLVLLSSSTSLSRFKFGSLYTLRRALFWIYFVLQCFTTEHPDKATIVQLRQDKGVVYGAVVRKLQMSVFSINHNILFKKILKNNGPRIKPCGMPKRIFNLHLKVKSSLTLCVRLERQSCKNSRLCQFHRHAVSPK